MILKFNNLIPVAFGVKAKNLNVNVGKIIGSEIKNEQLNVIVQINKRSINKMKKLLLQPNIVSTEIIKK